MVENVAPADVWNALQTDASAQMVDVRTDAEWNFVGIADLSEAGKTPALIPWQVFPSMQLNTGFVDQLKQAGTDAGEPDLLPVPQRRAQPGRRAKPPSPQDIHTPTISATGSKDPPNAEGHRGQLAGWKASDLPWRQR